MEIVNVNMDGRNSVQNALKDVVSINTMMVKIAYVNKDTLDLEVYADHAHLAQLPMVIKLPVSAMILDQYMYHLDSLVKSAQPSQHPMPMTLTVSALQDTENKEMHVFQSAQLMPHQMPQVPACAVEVNSGPTINATNHQSAQTDQHSINKHSHVFVTPEVKTSLEESVNHADKTVSGIKINVYVAQDSSVSVVSAVHAILDPNTMAQTVSAN